MFHRRLLILLLCSLGVVVAAARDAAAWPRLRRHRFACRCQAQSPSKVPVEVEQVLDRLRVHYPGKTNDQIIQVLRGYVLHDDSAEKEGMRWLAERLQRAKRQKEAVAAIGVMGGGDVFYDWHHVTDGQPKQQPPGPAWARNVLGDDFFASVVYVYFHGSQVSDAGMESVAGLSQLNELWLFGSQVTDAGLERLKSLSHLQHLGLSARITDSGLAQLKGLSQLNELVLNDTKITDAGLEHLKGLNQLKTLFLIDTRIGDSGLKQLRGLSQLSELRLGGTQVTDAGLEHLKGLSELYWLWLDNTKVTDAGVKKLQQALPNCEISGP
jgi:hypothetical protein